MQFFGNFDGKKENYCIFFYRIWLKKAIFEGMLRQGKNKKMRNSHDRMG